MAETVEHLDTYQAFVQPCTELVEVNEALCERRPARAIVPAAAYAAHPDPLRLPARPTEVWINHPAARSTEVAP